MAELDISIEYPFIKVVQECLTKGKYYILTNKGFKNMKKFIEKGLHGVVSKAQGLKKTVAKDMNSVDETLEQLIEKTKSIRGKYLEMLNAEDALIEICKKRLIHLLEVQTHYKESKEIEEAYHITRLDRLILDYFLREGYLETAGNLTKELELEDFSDMKIFTENKEIIAGLQAKNCELGMKWCVTHKTKLSNMKSLLEMQLRIQEFIELVKINKFKEAADYSKKYFKKYMDEQPLVMERVMTLLAVMPAFNESLRNNYKDLLSEDRWGFLVGIFMQESYKLHSLTSESLLSLTLQAGLASLKTTFCDDPSTKKESCPTCSQLLGQLAKVLPYSYHLHTAVVCKITGELMNENNPPMALPNGYVFSEKGLQLKADNVHNTVVCPITGSTYNLSQATKVFFC